MLRERQCTIADNVHHYLPTKYKNKNLARITQTIDKLNEIGGTINCHLPEECSSHELEELYEANEKAKNELDNAVSRYNKEQEKIEFIANQKGFQLAGYKFRREISHTDFSEPTPEELMKYVAQMRDLFYEASDTFKTLGDKYFADPPRVLAELVQDIDVMTVYCATLKGHGKDYKMTGNLDHSMERQYVSDMSGKHAAGNSDKFPTLLCSHSSKFETFDPDNFEIMKFDHTSPSNYRCAKCGGVDVIERGMSREQVGDRAAFIVREAQNIIRAMPIFGITLQRWVTKYIQVKEDSRKTVIAEFFSDSSMGKSYKVAKRQ